MKKPSKPAKARGTPPTPAPKSAIGNQEIGNASLSLLTMEEAIAMLKTTRPTFYRWVRTGKLRGTKIGRQWRFTREDVDRFVQGKEARIDLPSDIAPLINALKAHAKRLGFHAQPQEEQDKPTQAVDLMIRLAIAMNASDIHIDGQEADAQLRFRVDGVLHLIAGFDRRLLPAIIQRWKHMAALDIREESLPQDGRITVKVDGIELDMRVACCPAIFGPSIVLRLLRRDHENVFLDLDRLDFAPNDRRRLERWVTANWGIIVVTGPTGCGKTSTLYACLRKIAGIATKVMTIEDPVECAFPHVTQIQINEKAGLTFARALRSAFRSDPDVIMVGEIRNAEVMGLVIQAALTGHLVMTTLHTDEAATALGRMTDLVGEPSQVADCSKLMVAQRLVRRLCKTCSIEAAPPADLLAQAERLARTGGISWENLPNQYRQPTGCPACGHLGYRGRTVIAETLEVTPEIGAAMRRKATPKELRTIAVGQGMTTMAADAIRRAAAGEVSLTEVLSAVGNINY